MHLAVADLPDAHRSGRRQLVQSLMRGVDHAGLPARGVDLGHHRADGAVGAADGHMVRVGRIRQRTQHVEHAGHAQGGTHRADEPHGRVEHLGERKRDAHLIADLGHGLRAQIQRQSQRLQAVRGTAFGRCGAIAVLDDLHTGGRSHHRTHRGQVHSRGTVTAGADHIGRLPGDGQRHGVRHHRVGSAAHLLGGQPQQLLRGEDGTHRRGIGVALHQIVDEPPRLPRAQVIAGNQLGEDRFPCDLSHHALLEARS